MVTDDSGGGEGDEEALDDEVLGETKEGVDAALALEGDSKTWGSEMSSSSIVMSSILSYLDIFHVRLGHDHLSTFKYIYIYIYIVH